MPIQRVMRRNFGHIRQVKVDFADHRRTYWQAFERYVLELSRYMTITEVAEHLGVSWDVIKEIQKNNLQKRFSRPKLKDISQIAIDEINIGKGAETLEPFWKSLKAAKVKAVD
ncbi:MAG: transposase family protein [Deltaproteobacteria bacterium]|nr:transposase family protein [Deltaproteobacteria bacterium]